MLPSLSTVLARFSLVDSRYDASCAVSLVVPATNNPRKHHLFDPFCLYIRRKRHRRSHISSSLLLKSSTSSSTSRHSTPCSSSSSSNSNSHSTALMLHHPRTLLSPLPSRRPPWPPQLPLLPPPPPLFPPPPPPSTLVPSWSPSTTARRCSSTRTLQWRRPCCLSSQRTAWGPLPPHTGTVRAVHTGTVRAHRDGCPAGNVVRRSLSDSGVHRLRCAGYRTQAWCLHTGVTGLCRIVRYSAGRRKGRR